MRKYILFLTWLVLALLPPATRAQTRPAESYLTTIPDPKTLGERYVSDPDHVLQPATVQQLNQVLRGLDQRGRAHIDVVLTRSIGPAVPKTAATALFNRWQIGDPDKNNGLLLLLVLDQRRVEFETGYGLEADLPDILCYRIQQRYMLPYLREEQYDEAVRQGVAAIIRQLQTGHVEPTDSVATAADTLLAASDSYAAPDQQLPAEPVAAVDAAAWGEWTVLGVTAGVSFLLLSVLVLWLNTPRAQAYHPALGLGTLLILLLVAVAISTTLPIPPVGLMALCYLWPGLYAHAYFRLINQELQTRYAGQSRHARYRFLHEAHHGLGFMRYLFPVKLASYWPRYEQQLAELREAPYACPTCAQPMQRLDEAQDDAALQPGQRTEEQVQAVDYDVWTCPGCRHQLILDYANLSTDVEICTQCRHRTAQPQPDEVVQVATTAAAGWGWHVHECAFCQHVKKEKYTISKLSSSGSSSSSGGSSSFSSGGSFSSSSGGSSGGGGAGSSW
ncbi:TPM domain-containing protein [Hymenobacter metallicola]|uniref:TPM domain-containing protein n=1 Tax=Hymenobacter metallicola TaxID=2563114 RepID=UPI0019817E54|nr:TPM domain-containing protein [Hymenobacter metallicola]